MQEYIKLTKDDSARILSLVPHGQFIVDVLNCQDCFKGKAARYIKILAAMHMYDFKIDLQPYSFEPRINGFDVSWEMVDLIGEKLRRAEITKKQAHVLFAKFAGE